jgi:4-hydroxybenzoate polyprenyltransferase
LLYLRLASIAFLWWCIYLVCLLLLEVLNYISHINVYYYSFLLLKLCYLYMITDVSIKKNNIHKLTSFS